MGAKTPAIGINLGTSKSCVAVLRNGKAEVIPNKQGDCTTASCVAFTDTGRLIGEPARSQAALNPENTIFDVTRLIGRKINDPTVKQGMKFWPFSVVNDCGLPKILVEYNGAEMMFSAEEIAAMLLRMMKDIAEDYLGMHVSDAVITVPAKFCHSQRQAIKDAAAIAGLNVLQILNEPTAGIIAYGLEKRYKEKKNMLVFDMGGGRTDVLVVTMKNGIIEVRSTAGDTQLGGESFDSRLLINLIQEFKRKHKKNLSKNKHAVRRLRTAGESAKRTLSSAATANIELDGLCDGIDFRTSISRTKFEELNAGLFRSTLTIVKKALRDAQLDKGDVDEILLVGGSTRIPKIQQLLQDFFSGKELCSLLNLEEAAACGAAVLAAFLHGDKSEIGQDLLVQDVASLSLGVETDGGFAAALIKRGTKIPTRQTHTFTTHSEDQSAVIIKVYEGERTIMKDNNLLGIYELTGIPPAPSGVPKIEIIFDIDCNGILDVSVIEMSSGRETRITANDRACLSKQDVERMASEAESLAERRAAKNSLK